MQRPLKITARNFTLNAAFEAEIKDKVAALDSYYDRISGCEVTVGAPVKHHRKGGPFEVHIRLTVPNKELVVNHQFEGELSAAIREAFDAIRRQLEDHVREMRGDVKAHEPLPPARVSKLFPLEGYGFLETPTGGKSISIATAFCTAASTRWRSGPKCASLRRKAPRGRRRVQW